MIEAIVAMGTACEIGADNKLLWHLPDEFKWFVQCTKGKTVVMGRKTMESIGKPLKNRRNIVLSRTMKEAPEGFELFDSLDDALAADDNVVVIGGDAVYAETIGRVDRLYLTLVNAIFPEADSFFPVINEDDWYYEHVDRHEPDERHAHMYDIYILTRKTKT